MSDTIPSKIVREIVADILIERSNALDDAADELAQQELEQYGYTGQYAASVGWEAAGTRVLADEVRLGIISIKEAIHEILTPQEREEAKMRCANWIIQSENTSEQEY